MVNLRHSRLSTFGLFGLVIAGLLVVALVFGPARSQAADQPFKIVFDKDQVKIGLIQDLPVEATTSGGSIEGTVDEQGKVTIPADGVKFPVYGISDPIHLQAYMATSQPLTGTWDQQTGQLVLDGKVGIFARVNIPETLDALEGLGVDLGSSLGALSTFLSGDLACGFSPMDVTFSTENEGGARFTEGTLGTGAISGQWTQLGPFAGQSGVGFSSLACPLLKSMLPGLLEGVAGGSLPEGIDLGGLDLATLLDNLDDLNLGESSLTLTRTLDENVTTRPGGPTDKPNLKLSVRSSRHRVKAGKKADFTVKVKNAGDAAAEGVKVCVTANGPIKVQGKRCRTLGKVLAGATQTLHFKVKAKKGKKKIVKVSFALKSSNASGSSIGTRLLIQR